MSETWLTIPGYEGMYEVSDLGNVRSCSRVVKSRHNTPKHLLGKPMATRTDPFHGRRRVSLYRDGRGRSFNIATLVLLAFAGPRPDGMEACHNDGDRTNDRRGNLRWDTVAANARDNVLHGTHAGQRNGRAKITPAIVAEIRALYASGAATQAALAARFGLGHSAVSNIVGRRSWTREVTGQPAVPEELWEQP